MNKERAKINLNRNYWQGKVNTAEWFAWAGYAFENICYKHIAQILHILELEHIACEIGSWRLAAQPKTDMRGVQIDLIIDRSDDVIMLTEIKFCKDEFVIDKDYALNLKNKIEVFCKNFKTHKNVQLLMITSAGLKTNIWFEDLVDHVITAAQLIAN